MIQGDSRAAKALARRRRPGVLNTAPHLPFLAALGQQARRNAGSQARGHRPAPVGVQQYMQCRAKARTIVRGRGLKGQLCGFRGLGGRNMAWQGAHARAHLIPATVDGKQRRRRPRKAGPWAGVRKALLRRKGSGQKGKAETVRRRYNVCRTRGNGFKTRTRKCRALELMRRFGRPRPPNF